jgi:hypothetical protein
VEQVVARLFGQLALALGVVTPSAEVQVPTVNAGERLAHSQNIFSKKR